MNQLPQELTEAILDNLHDNEHALVQCSLVCRTWAPATRYHLLSRVDLRSERICHRFLNLLAVDCCTFIPHVTTLLVVGYSWNAATLLGASSLISRLTSIISIHCLRIVTPAGQVFLADLLPRFPRLAHLELQLNIYDSVGKLLEILDGCQMLTSLRIERLHLRRRLASETGPTIYAHSRSIRTLQVWDCLHMDILDIFFRDGGRENPNCTTASFIGVLTPKHAQSVRRFLHNLGPILENLTLGFRPNRRTRSNLTLESTLKSLGESFWQCFRLSHNTRLRHLRLQLYLLDATASAALVLILATISSHHLTRVTFVFYGYDAEYSQADVADACHALDDALSEAHLASIQVIEFQFEWSSDFPMDATTEAFVTSHMPRCSTRIGTSMSFLNK
ncbi:hypothetical protein C8J57DRAFT_1734593 [Mycena rebaudengoi]|nr:hypothetical protein C8J57DRAFT_1734593 [Mycena rebaudengoi]